MLEGNTTPSTRKWHPRASPSLGFRPRCPPAQLGPGCRTFSLLPPSSLLPSHPIEAPSEGQRRTGCCVQPHRCVGRHPLRLGNTWNRTYPATREHYRTPKPLSDLVAGTGTRCRRHRFPPAPAGHVPHRHGRRPYPRALDPAARHRTRRPEPAPRLHHCRHRERRPLPGDAGSGHQSPGSGRQGPGAAPAGAVAAVKGVEERGKRRREEKLRRRLLALAQVPVGAAAVAAGSPAEPHAAQVGARPAG